MKIETNKLLDLFAEGLVDSEVATVFLEEFSEHSPLLDEYINMQDEMGMTMLHYLASNIYSEESVYLCRKLLEHGANPNISNLLGKTPLHMVANSPILTRSNIRIMHILLFSGGDSRIADNNGNNALHYAIANEHSRIVELMLGNNFDINKRNMYDETPLSLALHLQNRYLAKIMSKDSELHLTMQEAIAMKKMRLIDKVNKLLIIDGYTEHSGNVVSILS